MGLLLHSRGRVRPVQVLARPSALSRMMTMRKKWRKQPWRHCPRLNSSQNHARCVRCDEVGALAARRWLFSRWMRRRRLRRWYPRGGRSVGVIPMWRLKLRRRCLSVDGADVCLCVCNLNHHENEKHATKLRPRQMTCGFLGQPCCKSVDCFLGTTNAPCVTITACIAHTDVHTIFIAPCVHRCWAVCSTGAGKKDTHIHRQARHFSLSSSSSGVLHIGHAGSRE